MRASSVRIASLRLDLATPSSVAARLKLPASTTRVNIVMP